MRSIIPARRPVGKTDESRGDAPYALLGSIVLIGLLASGFLWRPEAPAQVAFDPAIAEAVTDALHQHGVGKVRLVNQLSPAWTTDWMSEAGKAALKGYGIAPPAQQVIDISGLTAGVKRRPMPELVIACPNCGSTHTQLTSQFGSTPCKALYKCLDCREPFDYFKCH